MRKKAKYLFKEEEIELCSGEGCIHRYRCYRHSLYQDAIFKNMDFNKVDINNCINQEEEESEEIVLGFNKMWIPENIR